MLVKRLFISNRARSLSRAVAPMSFRPAQSFVANMCVVDSVDRDAGLLAERVSKGRAMRSRTISIVIPTHNKSRSLMRTLASLERIDAAGAEFEVIVVDDASNNDTDSWLANYRPGFPIQRLRNARKDGPASARNRGFRRASGETLLFLDDDMECGPTLVEAHMAHHGSGEHVAVVGRALYHPDLRRSALTRYFDAQHLRHASPLCPPTRFASNDLSLSRSFRLRAPI